MAVAENKTRVTITLGDTVLANLDEYCDQTGLSRSAAISAMIAEQLANKKALMGKLQEAFSPENLAKMLQEGNLPPI